MHTKTMIIDGKTVITGFVQLLREPEANDENLLVVELSDVAAAYGAYFDALFAYGGRA